MTAPEQQQLLSDMLQATANQRDAYANESVQLAAQLKAALRQGVEKDKRIAELETKVKELAAKIEAENVPTA